MDLLAAAEARRTYIASPNSFVLFCSFLSSQTKAELLDEGAVVLAQEMTRRWANDGIVSLSVHPGSALLPFSASVAILKAPTGVFESDLWRHVDKTGMDYKLFVSATRHDFVCHG
jgi:hypothetical protein